VSALLRCITDRSSQQDPFQSPAKNACGAWRLVGILEPRMAQRSSIARPTRAIPPLLPGLRRGEGEYAAYAGSGPKNPTTQRWFEELARDCVIIGVKASVNVEIARYREHSNTAAELGLRRFAHSKLGRAPPSVGYFDKLASARTTHARSASYLALLCERAAEATLILDRYGAGSAARTKTSARPTRGPSNG